MLLRYQLLEFHTFECISTGTTNGMFTDKKSLIISLSFSLVIAFLTSIVIIQHQPFIKYLAENVIHEAISKNANFDFNVNVESVNFFTCTIDCTNVRVQPKQNFTTDKSEWSWKANRLIFHFSPINILFLGKITMGIYIFDAQATSNITQSNFPFADHIQELFFNAKFKMPIEIKLLKMNNIHLTLHNDEYQTINTILWSGTSKKVNNKFKSMIYINHGTVIYQDKKYIDNITGTLYSNLARNGTNTVLLDTRATLPQHQNQQCFIDGQLHEKTGSLHIRSQNKQFILKSNLKNNNVSLSGNINIAFLHKLIPSKIPNLSDNLTIKSQTSLANSSIQGIIESSVLPLSGKFQYNKPNKLSFEFTNKQSFDKLYQTAWSIKKNAIHIKGDVTTNNTCMAIQIPFTHSQTEKECLVDGNINIDNTTIKSFGNIGQYEWNIQGSRKPVLNITHCTIGKKDSDFSNLHCTYSDKLSVDGTLNFHKLKTFLPESIRNHLDGNATIALNGEITQKKLKAHFNLKNGSIIFDNFYNILTGLHGDIEIDYDKKMIHVFNLKCKFHQGTILCHKATIIFSQNWQPISLHIPCSFDHCLIGMEKNFGILSGSLLLEYRDKKPSINGIITINRSFIHDIKFLTNAVQTKPWLIKKPIELNLKIESKEPTHIHIDQIQTNLHTQLKIKQDHTQPQINGALQLQRGSIKLPYSTLKIIHGALHFSSDQQFDPLIELVAKTNMHQYNITLQVTGSLKQPIIRLSSVPSLTEEKIAALVITGSSSASLNMIAPTLIIEYLKKQAIEHSSQLFKPQQQIQRLLKPLKHIKFTPTFTDETGRTGLYGGFEVDLGQRIQAKVQKNLNLDEDTLFEINYRLSDEVNLQAFKNDQGGIGGQVQMQLKW